MNGNRQPLRIAEKYRKLGIINSFIAETKGITLKELYGLEENKKETAVMFMRKISNVLLNPS